MSNSNSSTTHVSILGGVVFWGFIVVKISGHIFASWSWWWVLLPLIPWLGEAVRYFGL